MYLVGVNYGGKYHFMSFSTAMVRVLENVGMCAKSTPVLRTHGSGSFFTEEEVFCSSPQFSQPDNLKLDTDQGH